MVTVPDTGTNLGAALAATGEGEETDRHGRDQGGAAGGEGARHGAAFGLAQGRLTTSPPWMVEAQRYCVMSMFRDRNRTLPSARAAQAGPVRVPAHERGVAERPAVVVG
jgi:hypothetical protein